MTAPDGLEEILRFYGDPRPFIREDGTVSPIWELRMVRVKLPTPLPLGWDLERQATSARVNPVIAQELGEVFDALVAADLWQHLKTYDGAYAWRAQRGSHKLSMHAFGGALDFNAATNRLGTVGDMNSDVVDLFEGRGWTWGGRWGRKDGMHVQFATGY